MFEASIADAKFWKNCIDAIVNLIDEGILEAKEEGILLRATDPSQIAMVSFSVPKTAFSEYKLDSAAKMGLNFDNLDKIMGRTREKETMKMSLEGNKLMMKFKGESARNFNVPLLDISAGSQREPKIEYDAIVKIDGTQFKEMLRDASLVSSHLVLEASNSGFFVDARGDSADMHLESEKTAAIMPEMTIKKDAKATFPLQFLEDIAKACPEGNAITLSLKSNAPIKVEYNIGDASLKYYLAPRIETA